MSMMEIFGLFGLMLLTAPILWLRDKGGTKGVLDARRRLMIRHRFARNARGEEKVSGTVLDILSPCPLI